MKDWFSPLTQFSSSRRGAKYVLALWIVLAILLSGIGDMASNHAVNIIGDELPDDTPSMVAQQYITEYFAEEQGHQALLVFHQEEGISRESIREIVQINEYVADKGQFPYVKETLPLKQLPEEVQLAHLSDDETTFVLPVTLESCLEMEQINESVMGISNMFHDNLNSTINLHITGPAGIASDSITIFQNADMVLISMTIVLILLLLMIIYRSPLLALIPLIAAGIVYQVVDQILGLLGANEWLTIQAESISIMSILLFAALTDYSLFIFSRFREQLKKVENKYQAMQQAMQRVARPIFFSGGTVIAAKLMLLVALYEPYRNFAPVFAIAMVFILLAGLTLIPALFTLFGRKSFWPVIPKVGDQPVKQTAFWTRIGRFVTRRPFVTSAVVLVLFIGLAFNVTNIHYSYNLLQSFPEDNSSRVGFELLEEKYAPGDLSPTSVIVKSSDDTFDIEKVKAVALQFEQSERINTVRLDENTEIIRTSGGHFLAMFEITLPENPYNISSLDTINHLREDRISMIKNSGLSFEKTDLLFAGETARQADIREINERDTWWVISLVTIIITVMLGFHTRSFIAPFIMMGTILISYMAAMGLATFFFQHLFGYEQMSYRIPLYAFVFLVALGVDYNIMLVSRIREELREHSVVEAVQRGVSMTGGVISSAGMILAATFSVLMTLPLLDMFMFGFAVSIGILIDVFIVRGVFVPSLITILGKWSFWPNISTVESTSAHAQKEIE